jgi:hypothetical protein
MFNAVPAARKTKPSAVVTKVGHGALLPRTGSVELGGAVIVTLPTADAVTVAALPHVATVAPAQLCVPGQFKVFEPPPFAGAKSGTIDRRKPASVDPPLDDDDELDDPPLLLEELLPPPDELPIPGAKEIAEVLAAKLHPRLDMQHVCVANVFPASHQTKFALVVPSGPVALR